MTATIPKIVSQLPKPLRDIHIRVHSLVRSDELLVEEIDSAMYLVPLFRSDSEPARWLQDELGLTDHLILRIIKQDFPEPADADSKLDVINYTPAAEKMFELLGAPRIGTGTVKPPLSLTDMLNDVILSDSPTVEKVLGAVHLIDMREIRLRRLIPTPDDLNRFH